MTTDVERIAKCKIVYVWAAPGSGKSFTGDYLKVMHSFDHVDGDFPLKRLDLNPELYKRITFDFFKGAHSVGWKEDGPKELWEPYYKVIADATVEAAKKSTAGKVVLSHATNRQGIREYVVNVLLEGGASSQNITVLELTIDMKVKLQGLYHRLKFQAEQCGITLGDYLRSTGWDDGGDTDKEPTISDYMEWQVKRNDIFSNNTLYQGCPDDYPYGKAVDVSGRNMSHLDNVDTALGLVGQRNDKTLSFEEIRDTVKLLDAARDAEMGKHGQTVMKLMEKGEESGKSLKEDGTDITYDDLKDYIDGVDEVDEGANINGEEKEMIERRRSSLLSIELLEREFTRSSSVASMSSCEQKVTNARRRSSLILTGKIED